MKNKAGHTVYIAKNVKPDTWAYVDYDTTEGFKDRDEPVWDQFALYPKKRGESKGTNLFCNTGFQPAGRN